MQGSRSRRRLRRGTIPGWTHRERPRRCSTKPGRASPAGRGIARTSATRRRRDAAARRRHLERFAKSAYWRGRSNKSITLREAAYVAYLERGDDQRAALCALTLRREHIANMQDSVAAAWLKRAEQSARGTARVVRGHRSGGRLPGDRACRRRPGAWGLRAGAGAGRPGLAIAESADDRNLQRGL